MVFTPHQHLHKETQMQGLITNTLPPGSPVVTPWTKRSKVFTGTNEQTCSYLNSFCLVEGPPSVPDIVSFWSSPRCLNKILVLTPASFTTGPRVSGTQTDLCEKQALGLHSASWVSGYPPIVASHSSLAIFTQKPSFPASLEAMKFSQFTNPFLDGLEICWQNSAWGGIHVPCPYGKCPKSA